MNNIKKYILIKNIKKNIKKNDIINNNNINNKELLFIGYSAYGDYLSLNGMTRYLLNFFKKIYYITEHINHIKYIEILYNDILDKINIYTYDNIDFILNKNKNNIIIFNQMLNNNKNLFLNDNNKNIYYNCDNNISKYLNNENIIINQKNISNSTSFYFNNGLNPGIINDYFYFKRNYFEEDKYYNFALNKINISPEDKYIIISELNNIKINYDYIVKKNLKTINICNLVEQPLYLIKLLENAEEIHLFEHSNALMIYYLQITNNFNYKNIIYLHLYVRNRGKSINDMYKFPKLTNWEFIE